jgi:uncharacterized protein with HEPN domain
VKDDRLYLQHILECIERIERYTSEGERAFRTDTRTQDAVVRNLQVLAESTQRLSDELKKGNPDVPWASIAGLRNVLVHAYLGISLDQIWEIVEKDVPGLKAQVRSLLEDVA